MRDDQVQDNALKGRSFASLEEQNRFLLDWERMRVTAIIDGHLSKIIDGGFRCRSIVPFPCG